MISVPTSTPSALSPAYLLVAHGSRSPQALAALAQLAVAVREQLRARGDRHPWVQTACLELAAQPLAAQIEQVAAQGQRAGRSRLTLLPLLLQPGVHACEDIPAAIAQASPAVPLALLPPLGAQPAFVTSLVTTLPRLDRTATLLLAHGSRRPGSDRPLQALAAQLGASLAFWSQPPSLATQVTALHDRGQRQMVIQPYFLFPGRLMAAIAEEVARLQGLYTEARLHFQPPLASLPTVAGAIADIFIAPTPLGF